MSYRRIITLFFLFLLLGGAWWLVSSDKSAGRLTFGSAWELWSDVLRDADHFGLRLTRVSNKEEAELGDKFAAAFESGIVHDEKLQKYLEEVGASLTQHVRRKGVSYTFHIIDMPMINAFALPGGHIYVTKRMLNFLQTEAELAALLGHEIAHVDLRHCIERFQYQLQLRKIIPGSLAELTNLAYSILTVGYSKQQEHEADVRSITLAAEAQYHPKHALSLDDRIRDLKGAASKREKPRFIVEEVSSALLEGLKDYLATHPPAGDRILEMNRTLAKNESSWRGKKFYSGLSNHADRIARVSDNRSIEWEPYEEPPSFRAYLTAERDEPFKAFATHLASGLSAIAADQPTPDKAIEAAVSDCESKMKPCELYALGNNVVLGKTNEELDQDKINYLKDVCSTPKEKQLDACVAAGLVKRQGENAAPEPACLGQGSSDRAAVCSPGRIKVDPKRASAVGGRAKAHPQKRL